MIERGEAVPPILADYCVSEFANPPGVRRGRAENADRDLRIRLAYRWLRGKGLSAVAARREIAGPLPISTDAVRKVIARPAPVFPGI